MTTQASGGGDVLRANHITGPNGQQPFSGPSQTHGSPSRSQDSATTPKASSSVDQNKSILIVLLRYDLRIHDNPLFVRAHHDQPQSPTNWTGSVSPDDGPDNHTPQGYDGGGAFAQEWKLASKSHYLLPVYVFDERSIELSGLPGYECQGAEARTSAYGFWKTGGFRARFIVEAIADLRNRLIEHGSDILLRFGQTEQVLDDLVASLQHEGYSVEGVWMQKETDPEAVNVERAITNVLRSRDIPVRFSYGKTFVHPADLPFKIKTELPDVFTPFRKRVESLGPRMVRATVDPPRQFKPFPPSINDRTNFSLDIASASAVTTGGPKGYIWDDLLRGLLRPLVQSKHFKDLQVNAKLWNRDESSAVPFAGGETSALERLEWYFKGKRPSCETESAPVLRYKEARNNLLGPDFSTKMSPFLAYGCISPRKIADVLDELDQHLDDTHSTYWVRFELLWRDYFWLATYVYGDLLYSISGFETKANPTNVDKKTSWWKKWDPVTAPTSDQATRILEGRTGVPFIDACANEIRETGFMSNRARQNFASFLTKDLSYDWRIGAEFFESLLIDFDAASNYGNWQYVAGVGNDPRASRQFNVIKQAKDYDSFGEYVKTWLPALRKLPNDSVHTPWLLTDQDRQQYGLKSSDAEVGPDTYPARPMFVMGAWRKHYGRTDGSGSKMNGNPSESVENNRSRQRPKTNTRNGGSSTGGGGRGGRGGKYGSRGSRRGRGSLGNVETSGSGDAGTVHG